MINSLELVSVLTSQKSANANLCKQINEKNCRYILVVHILVSVAVLYFGEYSQSVWRANENVISKPSADYSFHFILAFKTVSAFVKNDQGRGSLEMSSHFLLSPKAESDGFTD